MKAIQVKFKWTELIRISKTRSILKKVSTDIARLSFEEIQQIHANNYKGIGRVRTDRGYLFDDWGHTCPQYSMNDLQEKIESRDVVYEVELNVAWLRFFPVIKSGEEMLTFEDDMQHCLGIGA